MEIEFDPAKRIVNLRQHKIDLADVEGVFYDPMAITIEETMMSNVLLFSERIGLVEFWWFATHGEMMQRLELFQHVKQNYANANSTKGEI